MTHSIWNDLYQQPTLAVVSDQYTKLVHDSTRQLDEPLQSILSSLDRRSMAFTKLANYDAALRDAKVMQQLSPSSALGYIREATIYGEQGKQRQVIDICNKGLDVVDAHGPEYTTLLRVRHEAEQHANKRIDFIKQLPVDIVITKLIRMIADHDDTDPYHPRRHLYVSRVWRDRVLQTFGGLCFRIESTTKGSLAPIVEVAPHVKALSVQQYTKGTWLGDLLGDNDFSSLRQLHVEKFWSKHIANFVSSLKSIGSTLTHLTLHMENGPKLGVPEVVLACPRLNMLHIMSPKNADVSLLPATTWPTITTLSLTYATTDITCNQIIEIWKRFPSLKKLDLSPGTSIQSALVVCDYCPTMKGLYISVDDLRIYLTYSDVGTCSEDPGITKLIIRTEDAGGKRCRDTSSIIRRHRNTLEHLEWDMDIRNDTENIAHIQLPRRTKLRLDTPVWQMIRNAPMLEELMLSSMIIINQPHVLDTIPPRLKSLDLRILGCLFGDHKSSLLRYLNRIALQHQLKHLAIHFSITDNDANILDAIYQHRHLECLKVILTNDWDSYRMARFVDGLVRSCTRLSHLQVLCNYPPSTNSMNLLKRLSRLNQFTFPVCGTGEDDSFWNAIRTFPQLKCITLYGPLDAEYARMKHLKQQRPDMKISKW